MQMSLQIVFDKTNVNENTRKIICDYALTFAT